MNEFSLEGKEEGKVVSNHCAILFSFYFFDNQCAILSFFVFFFLITIVLSNCFVLITIVLSLMLY